MHAARIARILAVLFYQITFAAPNKSAFSFLSEIFVVSLRYNNKNTTRHQYERSRIDPFK